MGKKHTKGPWEIMAYADGMDEGYSVRSPEGNKIVDCEIRSGNRMTIEATSAEANARLIAASPSLLAAAKLMLTAFSSEFSGETRAAIMAVAKEDLKKAVEKAEEGA